MNQNKTILITGGAGFIGTNASEGFIKDGWNVIIFDNLSRRGSVLNVAYLNEHYAGRFELIVGDMRYDHFALYAAVQRSHAVLHLAGQVAVTTSILKPREDFETNALGSHNLLEAIRLCGHYPLLLYASTNKVYGGMQDVQIVEDEHRYRYKDLPHGIPETRQLDFHSPYGCSKGTADQYISDYHRIYGLPTVVFRQSCIYGPHQCGEEDQGWVAWFIIASILGRPISIYGNGKQVRDVLHVDDLVDVYRLAVANPDRVSGRVYNIGGGPRNTLSLLELLEHLEGISGHKMELHFGNWRAGDQPVYISDIGRIEAELGWQPRITPTEGVKNLYTWINNNRHTIESLFS